MKFKEKVMQKCDIDRYNKKLPEREIFAIFATFLSKIARTGNFTISFLNFTKALFCKLYAAGLYLAVANNGSESRKITQLLHPTLAA